MTEQDAAKSRLKKQQQELEHMKLRYLAIEEQEVREATLRESSSNKHFVKPYI